MLLPIEGITADEFSDQTGGRNLVVHVGFLNKIQYLDDISHLVVAFILRLDCRQQREDVLFQHRQLIERGSVEDHIRMLLIGENPPPLSPAHTVPHGEGALHRGAAGLVVPDDAPQQTQVRGCDAVVVIQIQGSSGVT